MWFLKISLKDRFDCNLKCLFVLQIDKKRVVDESEGRLWADSKGFHYFETSAQTGEGIPEMFQVEFNTI